MFNSSPREKKPPTGHDRSSIVKLHGEVMACTYEDVRVMWSILDKSRPSNDDIIPSSLVCIQGRRAEKVHRL
ncbi:hypothetical protein OPV22_013206 [Ensete ventricosum]|uniref:Uncharacterized protein n=1 Tax=Ensete ventricosum TaxID=4639 RepID=A0AAV8R7R9_ENSVE|nr:hypothetical protein OPV22_013206 [Ensete ventricosum]